jgi:hypothetical protein
MSLLFVRTLALLVACAVTLASPARGGAQTPASFLLFPEYDTRPGQLTFLTLTNLESSTESGAIKVHFNYVDSATCLQSDFLFHLTPRDTVMFLASAHVPAGRQGYAWGVARHATTNQMIDFDHLIGALLRVDGVAALDWSVQPFGFLGKTSPGAATDLDFDGRPDLDGVEYEKAPNRFYVPRFFGQSLGPVARAGAYSDLILLQPLASPGVTTTTAFLIYNDNEEVYSAQYSFTCWTRVRLSAISGTFLESFLDQSNDNANEVIGMPTIESGWFQVRGQSSVGSSGQATPNPPVLGVMVELRPYSAADLPYVEPQAP